MAEPIDGEVRPQTASSSSAEGQAGKEVEDSARQDSDAKRLDEVADKPIRVRKWSVEGLERTRLSVVEKEVESLPEPKTFGELREVLQDLYISLLNLHIFADVSVIATEPPEVFEAPDLCDVQLQFLERNRLGLKLGGHLQGVQGMVNGTIDVVNTLGFAERLQLDGELSKVPANLLDIFSAEESMAEVLVRLSRARLAARPVNGGVTLHWLKRNNERLSSYKEDLKGGIATLASEDGSHSLDYELGWRQIYDSSRLASPAVQRQFGHSLKSSLSYLWRHNTFNHPFFPTSGYGIRTLSEFSGLWADPKALRFVRQEAKAQIFAGLSEGVALSLRGAAGVMLPWGHGFWSKPTPISERFSLGGADSGMTGFNLKGIGATDLRRRVTSNSEQDGADANAAPRAFDYLGGDLYASLLAELRFQLPGLPMLHDAGVYGRFFCSGGNNVLLSGQQSPPRDILRSFKSGFRWSAGGGLVWPTTLASFEVSYVRVLKSQPRDEWRSGFHFGCSASLF